LSQGCWREGAVWPSVLARAPEFVISFVVFLHVLSLLKQIYLLACRMVSDARVFTGTSQQIANRHFYECIRRAFLYFQVHQVDMVEAYIVMCGNVFVSLLTALIDRVGCNAHTWWLLNREMQRTAYADKYLSKDPPRMEGATQREGSVTEFSDLGSDRSLDVEYMDHASHTARPLLQQAPV